MARAYFVKKARKARPEHGIAVGDSYYWWAFMQGGRGGPKRYSKTRPKPSQLTQSEFWGAVFGLQEDIEAQSVSTKDDVDGLKDTALTGLDDIISNEQGKYDNLPDGLRDGEPGSNIQNRIDSLENAKSEVEDVDTDFDEPEIEREEDEEDGDYATRKEEEVAQAEQEWADEKKQEIVDALGNVSD